MPTLPPTATISAVAATTAKPAIAEETPPATGKGGEISAFAALFEQLATVRAAPDSGEILAKAVAGDENDVSNGLNALLASLDAGTRPHVMADDDTATFPDDTATFPAMLPDVAGAVAAVPITPPAPAAISAADGEATAALPPPLPARKTLFPVPLAADPGLNSGESASGAPAAAIMPDSPGREFAAHLTDAISLAHETRSPGSTASAVQQVIAQHAPAHVEEAHHQMTIARPVGTTGWNDEIGNRIAWMASQGRSQAELVLTPPHMGRIEVSLTLNGDQAAASFASANPVVRELLEAALPRLREALADVGIQLGQTQVGADHAHHQAQQEKHGENPTSDPVRSTGTNPAISSISPASPATLATLKFGRNLVDVFV